MSSAGGPSRRRIAGERSQGSAPEPASGRSRPARPGTTGTRPAEARSKQPGSERGRGSDTGHGGRPRKVRVPRDRARLAALRPPRHALRWFVPLLVLTVVAVAFGAYMGVRGVLDYREVEGIEQARSVAATEAGSAAETIFSYKHDKLDQHLSDSKQLMTDSFASEFSKSAPAVNELAPQRKIDVEATTRNAAVEECGDDCSPDRATVLVFFDQARTMPGEKLPLVLGQRAEFTMQKTSGQWRVDGISTP